MTVWRGSGRLIIGLGLSALDVGARVPADALDCQGGGDGYPGDWARERVSLAGSNAGKKI